MLPFCLLAAFVLGAVVGSFLNVCIARLPLEKTPLWPGSRCSHCLQPVRWYDNLPLVSYWLLGGRCRTCGASFSFRYFAIELLTALCFTGLFWLEVVENVHDILVLRSEHARLLAGRPPSVGALVLFGHHAVLVSLLIVATFCDLDYREIPLQITVPGTVLGLLGAVVWPWPWPNPPGLGHLPADAPWWMVPAPPEEGVYPWPVWGPLPDWLPPGSWQLGLATGLAGLLGGTLLLRALRILFSRGLGVEAMGLGDADLMMMAGSFVGWQPVLVAFFLSALPGLVFALAHMLAQAAAAWKRLRLDVEPPRGHGELGLVLEGRKVTPAELPEALAERVRVTGRRELLLDPFGLEVVQDDRAAAVLDAAREAQLTRVEFVNERVQPDLVFGVFRLLFRRLRGRPRHAIKVEATQQDTTSSFLVDGTLVAADRLTAALKERATEPGQTVLLIDTSGLEQWFQHRLSSLREVAKGAGVVRVRVRERGIPFGPALAAGTVVTLLAWHAIAPSVQPLLFNWLLLYLLAGVGGALMFVMAYGLRLFRLARG
jgi:leader peptidase (prepilin peptidase)/N-methyltransferase